MKYEDNFLIYKQINKYKPTQYQTTMINVIGNICQPNILQNHSFFLWHMLKKVGSSNGGKYTYPQHTLRHGHYQVLSGPFGYFEIL